MIEWMKEKYLIEKPVKRTQYKARAGGSGGGQRGRALRRGPRYGNDSGTLFKGARRRAREE